MSWLKVLKDEGVEQVGEVQSFGYGKFAHILDPEGNKVELWDPGIEADELADFEERHAVLGRESTNRVLSHAELFVERCDVEQRS